MDARDARKLFFKHAAAVAYVESQDEAGDLAIGSAFHIGEGVFVTARHCIEGRKITSVRTTEPVGVSSREAFPDLDVPDGYYDEWDASLREVTGRDPIYKHWLPELTLLGAPVFHSSPTVDVAAFRVLSPHPAMPFIELGHHWDDWVYRASWQLSGAVVMGYPPIPMTNEPTLVAATGEIHTFVVPRHSPQVHFILSSTARGGFSGGPAIYEDGKLLGVVTESLVSNGQPSELGFMSVLSIEPIRVMLEGHKMMPACQPEMGQLLKEPPNKKETDSR